MQTEKQAFAGWTNTDGATWTKAGCRTFVYREGSSDSATFDPERPYVVATTEGGDPTGETGEYETFATLQRALSRAQVRDNEMAWGARGETDDRQRP